MEIGGWAIPSSSLCRASAPASRSWVLWGLPLTLLISLMLKPISHEEGYFSYFASVCKRLREALSCSQCLNPSASLRTFSSSLLMPYTGGLLVSGS